MRLVWLVGIVAGLCVGTSPLVGAQRRATPAAPPPALLEVTPTSGYRVTVTVQAREALELAADRRFLRVEIRDARNRRASCVSTARPQPEARRRSLEAGERWSEWLDLRELCWGRSLAALEGAREVVFHFGAGRARGAWVVRTAHASFRALAPVVSSYRPIPDANRPARPVSIHLLASDAMRGAAPTFHVRVSGDASRPVRAFVRPEHVSFRVLTPSGGRLQCALPPYRGRALPDFFVRLGAVSFALDGARYCGPFEEPGIYEVTPVITLPETGAAWRIDAAHGTFIGAPSVLRVRSPNYVEQPLEAR